MACCRYVELNPIRAGIVDNPESYRWSSYVEKTSGNGSLIDFDPNYLGLGNDEKMRQEQNEKWVKSSIPECPAFSRIFSDVQDRVICQITCQRPKDENESSSN